jgi:glycosyltransferase involved in cell wall biosynthesis
MIGSVLRQTYRDFEIIIVNDGSTDNTAEVLDRISDDKIKIIHSGNNGPSAARNLAIENARGEIIMNLDADDMIAPTLLEKAYELFRLHPDAGIVYSDAECFGAKSGKFDVGEFSVENMLSDNRIISDAFFKKEDWQSAGGFSSEFKFGLEDWDFWLLILEHGRKVYKIPESLVFYRIYKDPFKSRTGRLKKDRIKTLQSVYKIYKRHTELYNKYPQIEKSFIETGTKLQNENLFSRFLKNNYYRFLRKIH